MATHSSILAWKIPRTEEPGVLQSKSNGPRSLVCYSPEDRKHDLSGQDMCMYLCPQFRFGMLFLSLSPAPPEGPPRLAPTLLRLWSLGLPVFTCSGNWDAEGWEHGMMAFPWRWIHLEPWTVRFHVHPHGFLRYLTLVSPNSITGLLIILKTVSPFGLPNDPRGHG